MFLPQEAGTSGKGIAKATPKIEKIYIVNFDKNIYSVCNPVQAVFFVNMY